MLIKCAINLINILPEKTRIKVSEKLVEVFLNKYANVNVHGIENLENAKKPTIFICNHLSNSDGLILNKVLKSINPTFVAGVKLSGNSFTKIGLNVVKTTNIVPNSADTEGIKRIINLVKNGESILIFPEGTRSRTGSMIEAKNGIVMIAKVTGAPIIPIGLSGSEKLLPVNMEGNMEKEEFHHAEIIVNIGQQFNLPVKQVSQDRKEYTEYATTYLMKKIAVLLPEEYRGFYR
ncbi:MAG: lysophospholipid acyltransferase family protein [Erysipelotrichaceae bacterium]|nr:lysophospholipid acyltransferase family protein [Erysipelotrichaceae bacterium]